MSRLAVACTLLLAAAVARAESPRRGSFDLSAGPYRPNIDSEFATKPGPYETVFGTKREWRFDLGISRAIFTGMGTLEAGVRTGFFQANGYGQIATGAGGASADRTRLRIIPTSVALTYRFDLLSRRWSVPLAPYGRAALERYNWWVTNGAGKSVESGATNGWSVTGGLALLLNFFDPTLAREFDEESGVNDTYLFFEVTKSKVNDFGSSSSWDLSDEKLTLAGGLLFVF